MLGVLAETADSQDGAARLAALSALPAPSGEATSIVSYRSAGQTAIIGPLDRARAAALALAATSGELQCTLLVPPEAAGSGPRSSETPENDGNGAGPRTIFAKLVALRGHLGQFEIDMEFEGEVRPLAPSLVTAHRPFDLVLDLSEPAMLDAEIPPPGYVAAGPGGDEAQHLARAAGELAELVGEFDKPRYFNYEPDICAHGRSGQPGCTRCIDACPANAIASLEETIEVDPHLCQGGGSCASACPTGAIEYAYPGPADQSNRLARMLADYLERASNPPTLLFHDGEAGLEWLVPRLSSLPGSVLPWQVEEVGSVGMDIWLSALAHGAGRVAVLCPAVVPSTVMAELRFQAGVARRIATSLGLDEDALVLVPVAPATAPPAILAEPAPAAIRPPARFAATG
ncbi:MAG: 4Fe-4S binding protein, partial [Gammaproteobacteria bacterium]